MKRLIALDKWLFNASVLFFLILAVFTYGYVVGKYKITPYHTIAEISGLIESLLQFKRAVPRNQIVKAPAGAARERFVFHDPEKVTEGYYAFLGWDEVSQHYSAWLYDHRGKQVHTWVLDYYALDPDGPRNGVDNPHGFLVLRDASIIVNFDGGDVMTRIDVCGNPLWIKQGIYHHSLRQAEDRSVWTWSGEGSAYSQYQYLVNFDPENGETLRVIGLIEDVIQNNPTNAINFLIRPDFKFEKVEKDPEDYRKDLFHPNDIDVLYSDLAPMFPDFEPGDLLISMKHLNLVAVIDPDDLIVKWASYGPWRAQHDPDFTNDGKISVYNNNNNLRRSEIIKIDPVTRVASNELFQGDLRFYSGTMGTHQYLPDNNLLIVAPAEGRILLVSATGKMVMEFNNVSPISVGHNGYVGNGIWIPAEYFEKLPYCTH